MIHIDEKNKTIRFVRGHDTGTKDVPLREYQILMAYQCPMCNRILLAYFETEEPFDIKEYSENPNSDEQYRMFCIPGAGGLELIVHNPAYDRGPEACDWMLLCTLSTQENLNRMIAIVHRGIHPYDDQTPVVEKVSPKVIDSLRQMKWAKIVDDICFRGEPMILVKEDEWRKSLDEKVGPEPAYGTEAYEAFKSRREKTFGQFIEFLCGREENPLAPRSIEPTREEVDFLKYVQMDLFDGMLCCIGAYR